MQTLTTLRACLASAAVCSFAALHERLHADGASMDEVYLLFACTLLFLAGLPVAR